MSIRSRVVSSPLSVRMLFITHFGHLRRFLIELNKGDYVNVECPKGQTNRWEIIVHWRTNSLIICSLGGPVLWRILRVPRISRSDRLKFDCEMWKMPQIQSSYLRVAISCAFLCCRSCNTSKQNAMNAMSSAKVNVTRRLTLRVVLTRKHVQNPPKFPVTRMLFCWLGCLEYCVIYWQRSVRVARDGHNDIKKMWKSIISDSWMWHEWAIKSLGKWHEYFNMHLRKKDT